MCTVSFLPFKDKVVLTSNRDEMASREHALAPKIYDQLMYPKDPQGSGSWIAMHESGNFVCLLNGAFEPHERVLPYRHSRGLVVTEFFNYDSVQDFCDQYNFDRIEPFTLVIWQNNQLFEFRWDAEQYHLKALDKEQAHIYSSAPLYTKEVIQQREEWFKFYLENGDVNEATILNFHRFGGEGNERTNINMKGSIKQTVSISQMIVSEDSKRFQYFDLLNDKMHQCNF